MDKYLEQLKEKLEEEVKKIAKKDDITPQELDNIKDAMCVIDMIDGGGDGYSRGMASHGYHRRNMPYEHMSYGDSYNDYPANRNRSYGYPYDDMPHSERMYHDGGSYENHSNRGYYEGDSYRRGRSPVTGRYISRGSYEDGYSGHSIKDRMVARLESMMDEAKTDHERQTVNEWINRLSNN